MIHGCAEAPPPPTRIVPEVVDLGPARCPDVDQATRAEARATTPRPAYDTKDSDGTPAYSRDAVRQWISAHEVSEARKNLALGRTIEQVERCRLSRGAGDSPAASRPPAREGV